MVYTVTELITNAYYKSGIRSRGFDTVSGSDLSVGLSSLNKMLAQKTVAVGQIPYFRRLNFNMIAGTQEYFIQDLIDISTLTFFINGGTQNGVRYPTINQSRGQFFGSARAVNIQSLPFNWHMERELGGARLYLYFIPQEPYPAEIWGLFRLASVAMNQDLETTLDLFYIDFLEFQVTNRLCTEFDFTVPASVTKELDSMNEYINKQSAQLDNKAMKISVLNTRNDTLNYADANLGKGWRP